MLNNYLHRYLNMISTKNTSNIAELEQKVYTIKQFCEIYKMSRASFYNLKKRGNSPRIIKPFKKCLIAITDADEWLENMKK